MQYNISKYLRKIYELEENRLSSVKFTSDGKYFCVQISYESIYIWDFYKNKIHNIFQNPNLSVSLLDIHPNSKYLLIATSNKSNNEFHLIIFDIISWKEIKVITNSNEGFSHGKFSPCGSFVAVCFDYPNTNQENNIFVHVVKIFSIDLELIETLYHDEKLFQDILISKDGKYMALLYKDIYIYDFNNLTLIKKINYHANTGVFTSDSKYLLISLDDLHNGPEDHDLVYIFSTESWQLIRNTTEVMKYPRFDIYRMLLTNDDKYIIVRFSNFDCEIIDFKTGEVIDSFKSYTYQNGISPDNKYLIFQDEIRGKLSIFEFLLYKEE